MYQPPNLNFMKKLFLGIFLLATALITAPFSRAQTYRHGDIEATKDITIRHDSSRCSTACIPYFYITIHNSFLGDSVKLVDTNRHVLVSAWRNDYGDTAWSLIVSIPLYRASIVDNELSGSTATLFGPIMKLISGPDTITGIPNTYNYTVTNPCEYGYVSGRTYIDNNSNCIYDTSDIALNSMFMTSTANLTGTGPSSRSWISYSNSTGIYNQIVQKSWMTSYTVSMPPEYYFIFPLTSCFTGAYTFTTLPQVNADFPLLCNGSFDVECWAGSSGFAQPLRPFRLFPSVSNIGCERVTGQMKVVKDSRVVYNPGLSLHPADAVSGDTLIWNYYDLTNMSGGSYWNSLFASIYLTPNSTVGIGDVLTFRVYTNVLAGDVDPANNDNTIYLPVVAAYDPNIKQVTPEGTGTTGDIPVSTSELTYTLCFQNTGTASAFDVHVVDSLNVNINPTTLKILSTSHRMIPEWLAHDVVRFNFPEIHLPDSGHDEPSSHGYVRFSVKLNSSLPVGTQISNKGYIYFDSNPAVITNTVLNTLVASTSIGSNEITEGDVKVYPNPVTDKITIENLQDGRLVITDITGKVIIDQEMVNNKAIIDISKYPSGLYILKNIDGKNATAIKFVKE